MEWRSRIGWGSVAVVVVAGVETVRFAVAVVVVVKMELRKATCLTRWRRPASMGCRRPE